MKKSVFLTGDDATKFEQSISETDDRAIHTEFFFVNSNGKSTFRPSHVVDNYMASVSDKTNIKAWIRFKTNVFI